MLRYCANLKAIRYESTSLNRIVADKSHRAILASQLQTGEMQACIQLNSPFEKSQYDCNIAELVC